MNTPGDRGNRPVEVKSSATMPCCPRCGQQALMTAAVPHGWDNPDGTRTAGTMTVPLCANCHHDDPRAGPLVMYLLVHEEITHGTLAECADLICRWTDSLSIPQVDAAKLEEEARAWQEGNL